jgi:serine/threonine protein kinase
LLLRADIVLEWVKGGDLLDYIINSESGLSEAATKDIAYQICDALAVSPPPLRILAASHTDGPR